MFRSFSRLTISICFFVFFLSVQNSNTLHAQTINTSEIQHLTWADSILKTLTIEEKIAQLMVIRAGSNNNTINSLLMEQDKVQYM